MQSMLKHIFTSRRRQTQRTSSGLVDRRSGAPVTRRPDPMPRMRWYS
jgi:hypothetical protein